MSGVSDTLDVLDGAGLGHTGSARAPEGRDGVIYEVGDVVVGHASYSYAVSGWLRSDQQWAANGLNEEQILADARELRERGAEFVVISLHWGIEFRYTPTSSQVTLGAALMESPLVDLIVGHHADVLQPVEVVNGKYLFYGLGNLLSNQEPSCCGEVSQEGALMLVRLEPADAGWSATEVRYVPTWVDRHRDHVILPTLSWDISEHRHAAWLERSLERVGRSLDLNDAGMSVSQACAWMMVDCSSAPGGADTKSGTTSAEQRPGSKALSVRSRAFRGRKQRRRVVGPPLSAAPTRSRGWCRRCIKEVDGPCSWLLERLQPSSSPG